MPLKFSDTPGRRERHLKRRHLNPLFGRPEFGREELDEARRADRDEAKSFEQDFLALVQETVNLKPNEDSEVILHLKERLDQSYEQACGLAGDQSKIKDAVRQLVAVIMNAVRKGAGNDAQALSELEQEEAARSMHYRLLETPLVADLLNPESLIGPDELAPSLLSEGAASLESALALFDSEQLSALAQDAASLLRQVESADDDGAEAMERLGQIQAHLARHS